jgi:hypothetical protein
VSSFGSLSQLNDVHLPQVRIAGSRRQPWLALDLIPNLSLESPTDRRWVRPAAVSEASTGVAGTMTRELAAGKCQSSGLDRPLEIRDSNPVAAALQLHSGYSKIGWVLAVVVDYGSVVEKQSGAIVREQSECITAGIGNPEATAIVDGEPFKTLR